MRWRFWRSARRIFKYHDGRRTRWADPLEVHRAMAAAGDWFALVGSFRAAGRFTPDQLGPELAAQADLDSVVVELATIVRAAFGVSKVGTGPDGRAVGLTDLECLALLADFVNWLKDVEAEYRPLFSRPSASPGAQSAGSDTAAWSPSSSPAPASAAPTPN